MASTGTLERTKGVADRTKRSRDDDGKDMCGMFYESDSADDELAKLMPALKRRFEALDSDQRTLNLMGELKMSNEASFHPSDNKENSVSDQNALRQPHRRRGSGRITTTRPINFDKLLTTMVSPSSGSLYKNITTALKENVTKAGRQSQIVDDFWSTERQKKISAVARRKLTGIKTPADSKPKAVEDRHTRHARSRRGGGNSRKSGIRPIKLDLYLEAAKISEWDQETLVEEEVTPSTRGNNGAVVSAGKPALQGNLPDFDQGRKRAVVQPVALRGATQENEIQDEGVNLLGGNKPNHSPQAPSISGSPRLLQDMDLSPGKSPLVEVPDIVCRGYYAQNPLHEPGRAHPDLIVEKFFSKEPTITDRIILEDSDDMEVVWQNISRSLGPNRLLSEGQESHPKETALQDRRPRDFNLEGLPWTPCAGFPLLESNLQSQHIPVTSPTPPSNPVAVYMSQDDMKHVEGDLRQRRLAFLSSPSTENFETGGLREEQTSDLGEMQSSRNVFPGMEQDGKCYIRDLESRADLCNFERDQMSISKGDVEGEKLDLVVPESRRDSYQGGPHNATTSKDDLESENLDLVGLEPTRDSHEGRLNPAIASKDVEGEQLNFMGAESLRDSHVGGLWKDDVEGLRLVFEEGESLRDLCSRREHRMTASKDDQRGKVEIGEIESQRALCHRATDQISVLGDIAQVEELYHSDEVSQAAPCDDGTIQEEDKVRALPCCEENVSVASCDRMALHNDKAAETERGVVHPPEMGVHCSVECDVKKFWHDQILNNVPSRKENSLLAIFHDYPEDDDNLVVPDVNETEPIHQEECNGTTLPAQTELNRLSPNHEKSVDQVSVVKNKAQTLTEKLQETVDSKAAPMSVDAQQAIAPDEGVVGTDEGSTTQSKPKRVRKKLKSEAADRRSSLEDSGTTWKDGQRRSQRIRLRPLEWWRGEKLLYGRVHQSMATVIGVKRSSPGKYACGIDDPFVVESYVPAKYSELVRLAAI